MEYKIIDISATEKELELSLTYDEIKQDIDEKVKERVKKIELPGFRKGKAPLSMIKKMYGDELEYDAAEKVAQKKFFDLVKEKDIKYYGTPAIIDLKFNPNENLFLKVSYEVMPVFEINNYKSLDVEVIKFPENPNEVQEEIDYQLSQKRTLEDADVVGDNDNYVVSIEVVEKDNEGKVSEDAKPSTLDVDMTEKNLNKDLYAKLKGVKAGDTFDFEFEDHSGHDHSEHEHTEEEHHHEVKKILYSVKVLGVKSIILPELNEELIKKISRGKAENLDEYKKLISDDLAQYRDNMMKDYTNLLVRKKVIDSNELDLPKSFIEKYIDDVVKMELEHQKSHDHQGHDHNHVHKSKDEIRKDVEKNAEQDLKWLIIRDQIIDQEKIEAKEEDLLKFAEKEAPRYGLDPNKFVELYGNNLTQTIQNEKFLEFLRDNNNIIYKEEEVKANE